MCSCLHEVSIIISFCSDGKRLSMPTFLPDNYLLEVHKKTSDCPRRLFKKKLIKYTHTRRQNPLKLLVYIFLTHEWGDNEKQRLHVSIR